MVDAGGAWLHRRLGPRIGPRDHRVVQEHRHAVAPSSVVSAPRQRTRMTARRRVALVGVAVVLLQALLFGWHHHGLSLAVSGEGAASVYNDLRQMPAAVAEDSCEICAVLHHQSSSPLAFAM